MNEEQTTAPAEQEAWDNIEAGENDHANTSDDSEMAIDPEDPGHAEGEEAAHPAEPALVPLTPPKKLTEFVPLTVEELAEKGKALAKEYTEIEGLKQKRSRLSAQIKEKEETIGGLVIAITTGQVEVPIGQGDLFRQPVSGAEAAAAFDKMAEEVKQSPDGAQQAQEAAEAVQGLNAMAAGIQAEQGVSEPSEEFKNDVENFKAKKAKQKKGRG